MKVEFWKIFTLFFVFSILFEFFALNLYHVSHPPKEFIFHKEKKKNPADLYCFSHLILVI